MKNRFFNLIACLLVTSMALAGCGASHRNSVDSEAKDQTAYPEDTISDTSSVTDTSKRYNQSDSNTLDTTSTNNLPNK